MSDIPFVNRFNYALRQGLIDQMRRVAQEWHSATGEFEPLVALYGLTDGVDDRGDLLAAALTKQPRHPFLLGLAAREHLIAGRRDEALRGYADADAAQAARVPEADEEERARTRRLYWLGRPDIIEDLRPHLPCDALDRAATAGAVTNVYFHVPFTGGSSVEKAWQITLSPDRFYTITAGRGPLDIRAYAGYTEEMRRRIEYIHLHFGFPIHQVVPRDARYATIVRDPVEITISGYFKTKNNTTGHMVTPDDIRDGASLMEHAENTVQSRINNRFARALRMLTFKEGVEDVEGYRSRLHDDVDDSELFDIASGVLDTFDFVGVMENYRESLALYMIQSGVDLLPEPPHEGPSGRPAFDAIAPHIRQYIRESHAVDARLYERCRDRFTRTYGGALPVVSRLLNS